jgi:hypothetical protein
MHKEAIMAIMGSCHCGAGATGYRTCQWRTDTAQHRHCNICGRGTYGDLATWVGGKADFSRPRIGVNARLLNGFDLGAVPVRMLDGRTLW